MKPSSAKPQVNSKMLTLLGYGTAQGLTDQPTQELTCREAIVMGRFFQSFCLVAWKKDGQLDQFLALPGRDGKEFFAGALVGACSKKHGAFLFLMTCALDASWQSIEQTPCHAMDVIQHMIREKVASRNRQSSMP
jgi:hypothetical protein